MSMGLFKQVGMVCLVLGLGGCSFLSPKAAPPEVVTVLGGEAEAVKRARLQWLTGHEGWSFTGRAAVSKGKQGGSVRVDWQQVDVRNYVVEVRVPITGKMFRLSGNSHYEGGRLEGLDGGAIEGEFADELLFEATGWELPVNYMGDWVRGLVADDAQVAEAVSYRQDGLLSSFVQMGWEVSYLEWHAGNELRPALPRRLEARSGDARVRLVIDAWNFDEVGQQ